MSRCGERLQTLIVKRLPPSFGSVYAVAGVDELTLRSDMLVPSTVFNPGCNADLRAAALPAHVEQIEKHYGDFEKKTLLMPSGS